MFDFGKYKPSALFLIAVNLVPLAGVLIWDWNVFTIVLLYWAENVILGGINVLKMITARPDFSMINQGGGSQSESGENTPRLFIIPFFIVHYGIFCLVHGIFIVALLGAGGGFGRASGPASHNPVETIFETLFDGPLLLAVLALGASHLFSFFVNYLGRGEYRKTTLPMLMTQPYGRIVVLQLTIILGAFAILLLGSPSALLVIFVVGKIVLDLKYHLREREKLEDGALTVNR